jgi:hypothetical protein
MNCKITSSSNRKAVAALLALLLLLTLAACKGAYSGTNSGATYPYVSGVTLQPGAAPSIAVAGTVQVGANGAYQDSATEITYKDVTSSATWSTSNAAVATVSKGLVTGTGIGSATITASLGGKTGTTLVVVGQTPTLDVTPNGTGTFSLSANPDQHFQASASYPDGSALDLTIYATWNSSVPGVLKFYDPRDYTHDPGEATLLATGTTTITASLDSGDVGSLGVTVVP